MLPRERVNPQINWGAVCPVMQSPAACPRPWRKIAWVVAAVGLAMLVAAIWLIGFTPSDEAPVLSSQLEPVPQSASAPLMALTVKQTSRVGYRAPSGMTMAKATFTKQELMQGQLLVVSKNYPLPSDIPAPNTYSLTSLSDVIPVKDATVTTSKDCVSALQGFFTQSRRQGVDGLIVWRGTLSPAQQRLWQLEKVNQYAMDRTLEAAVASAQQQIDNPYESEHQLAGTVDIRMYNTKNGVLDERALEQTPQGRYLLENAWKYGLIQRYPRAQAGQDKHYQFRYVGVEHATIMRELELDLDDYLRLLHEKRTILYQEKDIPRYYIACEPLTGDSVLFLLPDRCTVKASADNMGYAIVVCSFER